MLWLAFRMLFQERGRLIITLVGIVFSTVLTLVEVGIYLGMMGNATSVVRHTDADIWVLSQNVPNFDLRRHHRQSHRGQQSARLAASHTGRDRRAGACLPD